MGVDKRNHLFAPGSSPGWKAHLPLGEGPHPRGAVRLVQTSNAAWRPFRMLYGVPSIRCMVSLPRLPRRARPRLAMF